MNPYYTPASNMFANMFDFIFSLSGLLCLFSYIFMAIVVGAFMSKKEMEQELIVYGSIFWPITIGLFVFDFIFNIFIICIAKIFKFLIPMLRPLKIILYPLYFLFTIPVKVGQYLAEINKK